MSNVKYKRILLKISGEALAGEQHRGLDFEIVNSVCRVIRKCVDEGVQLGLVIGGGNFWRGVKDGADKMQRSHGDAMGMLATVMNAIAVADALEKRNAFIAGLPRSKRNPDLINQYFGGTTATVLKSGGGMFGYFPNTEAYNEGGYETATSNYKSGVAEVLTDEIAKLIKTL